MGVRGVAVLDAHDRLRLLDTLDCSTSLKICVEKVLYASVDALDERISIGAMASATAFAGNTATATTANSDEASVQSPGLYLGQLATQGRLTVYGFVTSVRKRVLVCLDWRSGDKISDLVVRDMLLELSQMYVEETAGNPFSSDWGGRGRGGGPISFRDRGRLQKICELWTGPDIG